jgi:replicative DNA helicase
MTSLTDPFESSSGIPLEYQVFALCFKEEGAASFFAEHLNPNIVGVIHGETGTHEFYKAILNFYETIGTDPIDPIVFRTWLENSDIFAVLGGDVGVKTFVDIILEAECPDRAQVLKLLQVKANDRRQLNALQELNQIVNDKYNKTPTDLEKISKLSDEIRDLQTALDINPLDYVRTATDMIGSIDKLLDIPSFLPTQFKSLNRAMGYSDTGGFYRGAVHALLASSGMGKSTFAKNLCNHWLDEGYSVLFINFEEAESHWERILFTQVIEKNVYREASNWSQHDREKYAGIYTKKLNEWGDRLMVRHDPDTAFFDDLEVWFKDIIGSCEKLPDIVVIDTIQSMFIKGSGRPRWAEFEMMMVRLEKLAKEMDAAVIITAQQNANALRDKREVINQADTGGSIAIQQKSSITIFITPITQNDDSNEYIDSSLMQLQIPKNRITGGAFSMDPPIVKYEDEIKSYIPWEIGASTAIIEPNEDLSKGIHNL